MDVATSAGLSLFEVMILPIVPGSKTSLTWLTLFAAQYLALKCYRVFLYPKYFSPLRHIPGPRDGHWLLGQAINIASADSPHACYVKWMREYPDAPFIRYLTLGNSEVLMVNSPNAFKEILQTQCYSFQKPDPWMRMTKEFGGKGVVRLEFDEHRVHRKMLNGAFNPANIRRLGPTFKAKASEVSLLFDRAIDAGQDGKTGVIDCTDTFSKAMMDIIGITLFGVDLSNLNNTMFDSKSSLGTRQYTFHEAYNDIFGLDLVGKLLMFAHGYFPTRWIPCEGNRRFLGATNWLRDTLGKLIQARRREIFDAISAGTYKKSSSTDVLSFMIEESLPGGCAEGMTDEYIVGHMLTLLTAGHDTTANMLSFSLHTLATQPSIQDKLRDELSGFETRIPDPTCTELDNLPYLDIFFKEVLRVYPTAVVAPRQASEDVTVEGVRIPKGTTIDAHPAVSSMNPLIWGEDADVVDPSRWDRLTAAQQSPYAYEVFSNGPRICIGKTFAAHEAKAVLYEIVRKYRFLGVEGPFTIETPGLVLRPNGMRIRLQKI
ncbi:cytochrome P450 [Xylariales sp. PMI_506]|nr:cytochrome P450 [Xylariales sp. PMI_506]